MPAEVPILPVEEVQPRVPTVAETLALMEQQTAQLESEADSLAGTKEYPEWYQRESIAMSPVTRALKAPDADPASISQYFDLRQRQMQTRATIYGFNDGNRAITQICYELGAETAARGFQAEDQDGPMHTAMLAKLTEAADKREHVVQELDLLRSAYGMEKITDLLGVGGDEYSDALRPLIRTENAVKWMRYADQEKQDVDNFKMETERDNARKWMSHALSSVVGIGGAEADNYVFAASRRSEDNGNILEIIGRFDHFGTERLRKISEFTGIHAFQDYSVAQLERMEDVLRSPREAAEQLAQHDVNVVMVNRVGDHNGVMRSAAADFEDNNDRTLFFEINDLGDIYRRMSTLHKIGIRPSTLVLAAHSAPGQFIVSDIRDASLRRSDIATTAGRNLVRIVNGGSDLEPGQKGYAMHGMRGMARLVEDYMQPSRAIDDDADSLGRKKILFQACHMGEEVESKDIDDRGVKFVRGMDSVISRLGQDLADNGVQTEVDVYGAPGGIQLHKSARGVRYSGQPTSSSNGRTPLQAVRIRLENGSVTQQNVDEIVLHKAA